MPKGCVSPGIMGGYTGCVSDGNAPAAGVDQGCGTESKEGGYRAGFDLDRSNRELRKLATRDNKDGLGMPTAVGMAIGG